MLAGPTAVVPELHGVVTVPVFGSDGELHDRPGYSASTKLYYAPPDWFQMEPPDPTDIDFAREILIELIGDFPFDTESSKAHVMSALLLPFVRPMIEGPTPLHLISKPKAGTGATLLAEILAYPCLGKPQIITLSGGEDERRRTLFSALRPGAGAMLLDNVTDLSGASLASVLTQTTMTDRVVGTSQVATAPNRALWLATGNNPVLSTEIARRTIRIHLDARTEHPELRDGFRHPELKEWVQVARPSVVWAALTLVKAWIVAGRPGGSKRLGGFEQWSRVMGGILEVAGIPGFLGNLAESRSAGDLESQAMQAFVQVWALRHGTSEASTNELFCLAGSLDLCIGTEHSRHIRLGKRLHRHTDQHFGKWVIRKGTIVNGYQQWRLGQAP
jgi:hypothetical protein